jgi:hypothetical protein
MFSYRKIKSEVIDECGLLKDMLDTTYKKRYLKNKGKDVPLIS